jgi:polyferredoxin
LTSPRKTWQMDTMKRVRIVFQVSIVLAVAVTGFRHAMGWSRTSIETYCPFGGLETAYALVTDSQFTCATGERNLALFVGLLILTLLARKAFCGWVCPLGTLSEWCAALGTKWLGRKRRDASGARLHALEPPRTVDRVLRWLRLPVLLLVLYFTYRSGELIFRGFDPYYILFSFHGHDVKAWSYAVLAVVLIGIVIVPMAWCRYLCPLGMTLWPFARFGVLRLTRTDNACTDCGACDRSCPQSLEPSSNDPVSSGDCTLCLKCMAACPEAALELHTPPTRR